MNFIIRAKVNKSAIVRSEKAWKPKRDDKLGETVHEIELNVSLFLYSFKIHFLVKNT